MKELRLRFENFWPSFDPHANVFVEALSSVAHVHVLDDAGEQPDLLIYSNRGRPQHYKYNCVKVYYTGENDVPDFNECDYAISFHPIGFGDRHLRYPLYMMYETDCAAAPRALTDTQALDRPFCSLVMSNSYNCDPRRLEIFDAVNAYKPVDSGGRWNNNVGGPVADKLEFISGYKFNLALENSAVHGYVTEKLLEPYAASTVPVYFGAPTDDFAPDSYIAASDYGTIEALVERIREVDSDPAQYLRMLRAPSGIPALVDRHARNLRVFMTNIVSRLPERRVTLYGEGGNYYRRNAVVSPLTRTDAFGRLVNRIRPLHK